MCGIAGIIGSSDSNKRRVLVNKMLSRMSYRGPDDCGIYHSSKATMGNIRLSIIDLTGGQQPISDPSGRYWIVYNGEIFNYIELRKDLINKGHTFKTSTDTEVIVHLYSLYGAECLKLLNGQFTFAVWDKVKEELFIARDRVGIRPFFYHYKNGVFTFASEIKSIFENPDVEKILSYKGLQQVYTFWACITPNTVFNGINELSPGHYLILNKSGLTIKKFWELSFSGVENNLNLNDWVEKFHELFTDAVRIRLRADVEVAAYLSGGIDSSATVSYIKNIEPDILNTFSIRFDEKDFDESQYQADAISYFKTNHKSIVCDYYGIAKRFPDVVWHSETPMTRTAPAPMMFLSQLVHENNIKVVITGEGADEIIAGYDIFKENEVRRFWAREPESKFRPLLLTKLNPYLPQMRNANPKILKIFYGYKLEDTSNPYYSHLLRWNNGRQITRFLTGEVLNQNNGYDPLTEMDRILPDDFSSWDSLSQAQWIEITVFMSGYLLSTQGDRMAMANSVEGRFPFLDYRLIEFFSKVPSDLKLKGLKEKYLLKKLVKDKIPDSILYRAKQPYRAPITSAFFSDDTPEYFKEMLSAEYLNKVGIFDAGLVATLLNKIQNTKQGSETENMAITAILSTQLLHHQFIEDNSRGSGLHTLKNLKFIEE
jgi:asparagine synthase (glutamine-hydrolysing)